MLESLSRRKKGIAVTGLLSGLFLISVVVFLIWRSTRSEVYVPGGPIEGVTSSLDRQLPAGTSIIRFENTAAAAGVTFRHLPATRTSQLPEDMGSGVAWGDYDGDGWDDLFLANIAGPITMSTEQLALSEGHNTLYRNLQDGRFVDVSEAAGVDLRCWCSGGAWGDYDNDGDSDLFVTAYGENRLYRNIGNGRFEDGTKTAGVGGVEGYWTGASWADYDRDGWLDLYVAGYVRYTPGLENQMSRQYDIESPASINPSSFAPERNLLYHSNGDGSFSEVAVRAGVDNPDGRSLSAAWADFDDDGWPDLYVANDVSDNALYRNLTDGSFEDISHIALVADYRGAMGLAIGDWDGDEDLDLFVTHWIAQENALYSNRMADAKRQGTRADGVGRHVLRFIDVADRYGLGQLSLDYVGWGTFFFDYDNDGRNDLFISNGSTFQVRGEPTQLVPMRNRLFWNGGSDHGFFDVSEKAGADFETPRVGRGAAFSDYDHDGDPDIAVSIHGGTPLLLRNDGPPLNHWLDILLTGRRSNRDGIGSRIRIVSGDLKAVQEVGTQASYMSQSTRVSHFGLGSRTRVDTVEVRWPSGESTRITNISVDQVLRIHEGQ